MDHLNLKVIKYWCSICKIGYTEKPKAGDGECPNCTGWTIDNLCICKTPKLVKYLGSDKLVYTNYCEICLGDIPEKEELIINEKGSSNK